MSKVKWPGAALIAPVPPVLVTSKENNVSNVLTVGWVGILNTKPPMTYISLRPSRLSYEIIKNTGEFTINLGTVELVQAIDFCGVRSGRDVNKIELMHLDLLPGDMVNSPMIEQSPVCLECKVKEIIHLGSHDLFISDIVSVHVKEELIDANGKLHMDKANLLAYAHGEYFGLGKKYGTFGYTVRKNKKKKKIKSKK
jgi:flavin reductase (DIM6/NTAB) family NADH-FMN oxidoreductase RutF